MSNKFKLLFFALLLSTNVSYAEEIADDVSRNNDYSSNDYDASYYEDEGRLLFKVRGSGIFTAGKQKKLPPATSTTPGSVSGFVKNGYGADTATTIFFNEYVGVELSLGFNLLKIKNTNLANIANNYNGNFTSGGSSNLYMIPLNASLQFHAAPFGAIRPYVGLGGTGAYLFTRSKNFKINNGFGGFLQVGVDLMAKDDTLITLDIRQYHYKAKVSYKNGLTGNQAVSSRVNLNPLMISVGAGFRL